VNIIRSTAERQAAVEFARAAAQRPLIVGQRCRRSPPTRLMESMYSLLEMQRLLRRTRG